MASPTPLIAAGLALAVFASPAAAAPPRPPAMLLAQAEDAQQGETAALEEQIAAAEQAVEAARTDLRAAMAAGEGVEEARAALDEAVRRLNELRASAGLPPVEPLMGPPEDTAAEEPTSPQPPTDVVEESPPEPAAEEQEQAEEATEPPAEVEQVEETEAQTAPPAGEDQAQQAAETPEPPTDQQQVESAEQTEPAEVPPALKRLGKPLRRFGEVEPTEKPVTLPESEAAVEEGEAVEAQGGRTIVREGGELTIRHDDLRRLRQNGAETEVQRGPNGTTTVTLTRPDGVQIVTVRGPDGTILQRYRRSQDGQIQMLIGATPSDRMQRPPPPPPQAMRRPTPDFDRRFPPLRLQIPRNEYIVESSRASQQQLEQALIAPPVEEVERAYTLEEIRRSERLRDKVRRIDFDTVTFEFGSAVVPYDQIPKLQEIGEAINDIIARDPNQVVMIEGHTDAVGSDLANLALSDRRAETVAEILTYYFDVPPENLVTQGYGERYLKVPTAGPERENRRVAFRNITWLMRSQAQQ